MSEFSDQEIEDHVMQEVKVVKQKKAISDKQREARIENLRKGRITRMKNIELKKEASSQKHNPKMQYKVEHENDSESSNDSSTDEELVLTKRRPTRPTSRSEVVKRPSKQHREHYREVDTSRAEIAELKALVMKLAKDKQKKKRHPQNTIINVTPAVTAPVAAKGSDNGDYSEFFKTRILKL